MRKLVVLAAIVAVGLFAASQSQSQSEKPTLFQKPALNKTRIVFVYGGDLWSVPR
jgi:hypothetical protein